MINIVVIPSQHTQNSEVLFMSEHVMDFLDEKKNFFCTTSNKSLENPIAVLQTLLEGCPSEPKSHVCQWI